MEHWFEFPYAGPLIHKGHAYAAYLDGGCHAAVAVVRAAQATCPTCGQPVTTVTPLKDANVTNEAPPSGWRDREPLL